MLSGTHGNDDWKSQYNGYTVELSKFIKDARDLLSKIKQETKKLYSNKGRFTADERKITEDVVKEMYEKINSLEAILSSQKRRPPQSQDICNQYVYSTMVAVKQLDNAALDAQDAAAAVNRRLSEPLSGLPEESKLWEEDEKQISQRSDPPKSTNTLSSIFDAFSKLISKFSNFLSNLLPSVRAKPVTTSFNTTARASGSLSARKSVSTDAPQGPQEDKKKGPRR